MKKNMQDNPYAYCHDPKKPSGDITIMFTRKRANGSNKDSSAVIPKRLIPKIIAILHRVDRGEL
jgi:hypothetical protein